MTFKFRLNLPRLIIALVLMAAGILSLVTLSANQLILSGSNFTSIGLLVAGLVFYCGIIIIIMMFENETILAVSLLLPSILAVAIFVYGFIGWSMRVSLSKWK